MVPPMAPRFLAAPWFVAALAAASTTACAVDYSEDPPPSLTDVPPVDSERDELVFERSLRWWAAPTSQRARLYRRSDGSWLMIRDFWDGTAAYAWAEGSLTDAGEQRLADALATVDTNKREPAPGEYGCVYADTLGATVYVDGEAFEYLTLCPPEGMAELATLYEDMVGLLLDCPLDPSWYDGEPPLEQTDCAVAGD